MSLSFRWLMPAGLVLATSATGQMVNIGLYPTAVPDSFEVRMVATAGSYGALLNASFTVRWEDSAGGNITSADLASDCAAYNFFSSGGVVVDGGYRYFTFFIFSLEAMGITCPITTLEEPIGGFRITGLNGCRNVRLVNDAFTFNNNRDYYMSVGGMPYTGFITTGAYASGACPPCTPPQITSASATGAGCLVDPVVVAATATGTAPAFQWFGQAHNYVLSPYATDVLPDAFDAPYMLLVINDCGIDTAEVPVAFDTTNCTPPDIQGIAWAPWGCNGITLSATVTGAGNCAYYDWTGPGATSNGQTFTNVNNYDPGVFQLVVTNACGTDSARLEILPDSTGCNTPVISSIVSSALGCAPGTIMLQAQVSNALPCPTYTWTGPVAVPDGAASATVNNAVPGTYQLIVTNVCGSDTLSVVVDLDTTACTSAPEILGISTSGIGCPGSSMTLQANVVANGDCVYHTWTGPVAVPDGSATAVVNNPMTGLYQLVASNGCGADTMALDIAPDTAGCEKPVIQSISASVLGCPGDPLTLQATTINGGPCPQYIWTGPQGMPDGAPISIGNTGLPGTYQVVMSNACGSDTATITVALDTSACVPPVIDGITWTPQYGCNSNVIVQAQVSNGGPCPQYAWVTPHFNTNLPVAGGPPGGYQLVVSNACGTDTAWVNVPDYPDTAACVPPTILSISPASFCGSGAVNLSASIANSTPCPSYAWTGPNGFHPHTSMPFLQPPVPGTYQLIFSNACGSDTLAVDILPDTVGCQPPQITSFTYDPPGCTPGNVTLHLEVDTVAWCTQVQWSIADGTFTGPYQPQISFNGGADTYSVLVINSCGADSATVQVFGSDTVGCVPPAIDTLMASGPICAGDTLNMSAMVTGSPTCMNYDWSGPMTMPDGAPYVQVITNPNTTGSTYTLTVSNPCGTATASITAEVIAVVSPGSSLVCSADSAFSLNDRLGFHVPGGVWLHDGALHSGWYDPANDTTGTYYYQDPSGLGCPDVAVGVYWQPSISLGTAGTITVCSADPAFDLFSVLGGNPDPGGYWTQGLALVSPIYDPPTNSPGTRFYRHNSLCASGTATPVTVAEILAEAWFADVDGDGLGDPGQGQLACDQPVGWVINSDDVCPLTADTLGTPCDDGQFWTYNDAIDTTCACTGELALAVDPLADDAVWQLWPNPNNGEEFRLSANGLIDGKAMLLVHDLIGNLVMHRELAVVHGSLNATIHAHGALAQGVYDVRLHCSGAVLAQRMVVQ
ncbi:MAG: hypothetical protein IPJ76_10490 [Flavobacteriales bacterium]|nr:MAG: hypothetical protein IPJ76_10490 [Flavobacteriales bacterium]